MFTKGGGQLALGLSGFETGVTVMPLVRDSEGDKRERLDLRVRNTGKLLMSAALIMSFFLVTTRFVTIVLIPPEEFKPGARRAAEPWLTWRTNTSATRSARPTA